MTTLEKYKDTILKYLPVHEIYTWLYNHNGQAIQMVHLQVPDKHKMSISQQKCARLLAKESNIHFSFNARQEIQAWINEGFGRFHLIYQPHNRIYQAADAPTTLFVPDWDAQVLIEQTSTFIAKYKNKIQAFLDGYHFYYSQQNYSHGAFMLHQAFELSLRIAQKLITGEEKKCHSLKQNIDFFKPFDTHIATLYQDPSDLHAINTLTESYTQARYKHNYDIDPIKIDRCESILQKVLKSINLYEYQLYEEIKQKETSPNEVINPPKKSSNHGK